MSEIDIYWLRRKIEDNLDSYMASYYENDMVIDTDDFYQGVDCVLHLLSNILGTVFRRKER